VGIFAVSILPVTGCTVWQDTIANEDDVVADAVLEAQVTEKTQETQETPETPETETAQSVSWDRYVYGTLDDETRQVYDEVLQTIFSHEESAYVSTTDEAVLDAAYKAVCADYGEIFWASGYVYTRYTRGDELLELEFAPKYKFSEAEQEELQLQIDAKAEEILSSVSEEWDDYLRAKYVFEYLASNVDYDVEAPENQNIISTFLYGKTVCQGYACATQYLLRLLGIQSAIVTGEAAGESHAWNLVRLDGKYYYIDTTWGNSSYLEADSADSGIKRFINYNYFGVTSEQIELTHVANDVFALPECNATADNYYVREGKYFTEWNPDAVGAILQAVYEGDKGAVSVRFASAELYDRMHEYLIEEEHITDYCSGISRLTYVEDATQQVLTFRF
jgi:hypothetical protein